MHGPGLVLTGVERHVSIHGCVCVSSFDVCINREPLGESATGEDFLQALIPHSICCSREHAFGRGHPDISATVRDCGKTRRGHALPVACVARCQIGTRDRCATTSNKILVCTLARRNHASNEGRCLLQSSSSMNLSHASASHPCAGSLRAGSAAGAGSLWAGATAGAGSLLAGAAAGATHTCACHRGLGPPQARLGPP